MQAMQPRAFHVGRKICKRRFSLSRALPSDLPHCPFPGGSFPKVGGERRKRTVFSPSHVKLVKKSFEENPYPGYETRESLARCIGIEEDRVHTWFQN
ncbi:homeobox A [Podarcis lilfordi]|uniref:Homeobox A n=1 Tax=Podarcis lilfordi TaxID=74358 RepID=A0AA35P666_9SAUR|nr:homeobox A [Podarcis lilfordi]